jgi:hypothetical protein
MKMARARGGLIHARVMSESESAHNVGISCPITSQNARARTPTHPLNSTPFYLRLPPTTFSKLV